VTGYAKNSTAGKFLASIDLSLLEHNCTTALLCLSATFELNQQHDQFEVPPLQWRLHYNGITRFLSLPTTWIQLPSSTNLTMVTLAPLSATPARQPFGILDSSKLRSLQSVKNCQNGTGTHGFTIGRFTYKDQLYPPLPHLPP
jgi:hypothetical protein